ncbi:bromodomain-containing protein 4-like [Oppia nitens]|uniref:bromodomain-containing protein 4-like n=1 Tax=Oppia nitens TaxID=1686743 RepID=UPI0023DB6F1C|nr:bromodomain-containing protein 4-like [Oppia nitens]
MSGGRGRYHPYKSALIRSRGQAAKQQEPEPYLPLIQPPVRQPQPYEEPIQQQIYGYQQPQPRLPPAATHTPSSSRQAHPYVAPVEPQISGYQQPQSLPPYRNNRVSVIVRPRKTSNIPVMPSSTQSLLPSLPAATTLPSSDEKVDGLLLHDWWMSKLDQKESTPPQPSVQQQQRWQPYRNNRVSVIVRPRKTSNIPVMPSSTQSLQSSDDKVDGLLLHDWWMSKLDQKESAPPQPPPPPPPYWPVPGEQQQRWPVPRQQQQQRWPDPRQQQQRWPVPRQQQQQQRWPDPRQQQQQQRWPDPRQQHPPQVYEDIDED